MQAEKQAYCPVAGTALYYQVSGAGPAIVLLHGNPVDASCWDFQVPAFSEQYQTIRYDLRGFGRSAPADLPYSHAGDLKSLLDYLGLDQACLVGWSMGGGACVNFALLYPERVKGMVLVSSSLGGFPYSQSLTSGYFGKVIEIARQQGLDAAKELLLQHPQFASLKHYPAARQKLQQCLQQYSGWHWLHSDKGQPLTPPAMERLGQISTPALVITGEFELPDFKDIGRVLSTHIAGAEKVEIAGVGHCAPLEQPEYFNQLVLNFLDRIEKRQPHPRGETAGT